MAANNFSLRSSYFSYNRKSVILEDITSYIRTSKSNTAKINVESEKHGLAKKAFLATRASKFEISSKWIPHGALSSIASAADFAQTILEDNDCSLAKSQDNEAKLNRVNYLVLVLHKSARSFNLSMQKLELARTGPPVAMAWAGVDVHAWHKKLAYQVAAYALLKSVIEVELFLSHNRNNLSPVHEILSPNANLLGDRIEIQLNARNPQLVQWFRIVELPRLSGLFMPLFKKWSMEYAGSGVAGTITAITCCASVGHLCSVQFICGSFSKSIEDMMIELMNMTQNLVSVNKLHHLAIDAGFEEDFLFHFGRKILPSKNVEDIEFWIGLVQRKLCVAFQRESVIKPRSILSDKIQEKSLAILCLFAYLGRESRLFLLRHNIKDVDEQINDFLSYLENCILSIYPEFSTLSEYQLLTEVIIDEIGWLDFYSAYNCQLFQERRRSKNHPIQAEQEIISYAVFTVCYDVISGFAHFSSSTQQALDANLLDFLLHSQGLLSTCLEEYWAAYDPDYDRTGDMQKIGERNVLDSALSILIRGVKNTSFIMDARIRLEELRKREKQQRSSPEMKETSVDSVTSKPRKQNFIKKSTVNLVAASIDVLMGTQLLLVDISDTMRLIVKKLRGHKVTKREKQKIERTMSDMATLIPVAILILLPVSAVGHAAMFAAIKKYIPFLIPSPYSDDRLNLVKQLERTKKMEVQRRNTEDETSKVA